ncbi:MAG: DMT family transporter [Peptococcaceae bacterium]|nr:DMT family transporter [Peptococcaceae bacterium]
MAKNKNDLIAYCFLLGAIALWGGNWVAVRYVVQVMPPMVGATIRMFFCSILLLVYLKIATGRTISLKGIGIFIFLGLMQFGFNFLQYIGLTSTTAINGSLINTTTPIFTILLSRFLIKERMSKYQLLGVLISFVGVGWVITNGSWEVVRSLTFNAGDILIIGAVCCWSLYTIYSKKQILATSAVYVSAYVTLISFIYFLPFGIAQYQPGGQQSVSWTLVAALIFIVGVAIFGLIFWNKGVGLIGAGRASVFINLIPVFTLLFASLFLQETITLNQLIGGIIVIGGVYLTSGSRFTIKMSEQENNLTE